ncbi:Fur family ferric uptake transcriptional regulator [Cupriavidus gilardii J11]|uniref:Ferric uptake regulation protein n=1 Tax=Cupriavidus gilardii J11 TaxID=936133 RepID=A0A562BQG0_9BURK|nr:transcriptional repressor [Cupriavidus gilardii]TWG87545.1 Fur family ferric uptake transcriptional regulator [Cupriavidus gilardii J11]
MERMTRQREAVLNALREAARPLSPAEILAAAQRAVPTLGLATVYRNIRALVKEGGLIAVPLPGQADRYEAVARPDEVVHKHYFQCLLCDRVFPLEGCPGHLDEITPPGFEVEQHELTLRGRCGDCAKQARKGRKTRGA